MQRASTAGIFFCLALLVPAYRDIEASKSLQAVSVKELSASSGNGGPRASPDAMPVLLLCFLVFDMLVLYLSNSTYKLMRENFFKMVSHTISIFCALLIEMSVTGLFLKGFLHLSCNESCPYYRSVYAILLGMLFPAWFLSISLVTWWVRKSNDDVFALGGCVAHVAAFVAIDLSVRLDKLLMTMHSAAGNEDVDSFAIGIYLAGPFVAMLACKLLAKASYWLRKMLMQQEAADGEEAESHAHGPYWDHEAAHCELECAAILAGFLCRQALLVVVQDELPTHGGYIVKPVMAPIMFLTIGGLLSAKSTLAALPFNAEFSQLVTFVHLLLGMTTSWCFMSFIMFCIKQSVMVVDHQWLMLIFVVSAICIGAMFMMGYMAEWRMLQKNQLDELIVVCGVATGLAWEKSFAWATREVIIEDGMQFNKNTIGAISLGSPALANLTRQLKLLEVWSYLLILAVMMPAWRWYIVPLAHPHKEDHPQKVEH
ncbi:unnamed protein product [Effrenium voratum]|nr:unnamed protein product [Effrenium voratum]|mmetsp:Transcript_122611/g.291562  ORF Transcript_122611/g.291562 Transcript_122611/m.291562 type:complete len:484 (+) Transcript_122611:43-1494(+)